jgi:methionine sulfoxide reductase catalytic subunit
MAILLVKDNCKQNLFLCSIIYVIDAENVKKMAMYWFEEFVVVVLSVAIVHVWATGISLKKRRLTQNMLDIIIMPLKQVLFSKAESKQKFHRSEVSPFFRINGLPPDTKEYKELVENNFANYNLKVYGLVERPSEFSLSDLYSMQKQTQITEHFCIQGWTAIAEWAGVSMTDIIELCKPTPNAHYVVFRSYQITNGDEFY